MGFEESVPSSAYRKIILNYMLISRKQKGNAISQARNLCKSISLDQSMLVLGVGLC